jgi:probable HAF family extracellular repeat protein
VKRILLPLIFLTTLMLVTITASASSSTPIVIVKDLKTLVGHCTANSINDNGQIVGGSSISNGNKACYWENGNSDPLYLKTLEGTLLKTPGYSYAYSVNDKGQIVGQSRYSACYWENSNSYSVLPLKKPVGTRSSASSINDKGQIVGTSFPTTVNIGYACYWENSNSDFLLLKTPGGTSGSASSINDKGQIVGTSATSTGEAHACYWENSNSEPVPLKTLGGTTSSASSINDKGQIVGTSATSTGETNACYWENSNSDPLDLKTLGGPEPDHARSINDKGQIVGSSGPYACLWTILTPEQATEKEVSTVKDLVSSGVLNKGQGTALTVKLEKARTYLKAGDTKKALNELNAFVNQVNSLIVSSTDNNKKQALQALLDEANAIIKAIKT